MRKHIYTLVFTLFSLHNGWSQQEMGLLFNSQLVQSPVAVNPAIITQSKINFALPNLFAGYQNSGFQAGDLVSVTAEGKALDLDPVLLKLKAFDNNVRASATINTGAVSFRIKQKFQLSLFHNTRFDARFIYPKALPELIWKGNGAFIGQEVEVGPKLNLLGFSEYGLGFAARLNEKMTIGANLKYLNGFLGFQTVRSKASVFTDEEYYQLTLNSDILFQTAGLTDIFDSEEQNVLANTDPMNFLLNGNNGLAIDLGLTFKPSDKLELQLALRDIGSIHWKEHALEQKSQGTFQYNGQIVRPFNDGEDDFDFGELRDTLAELFDFSSQEAAFTSKLPLRFYFGANYRLHPKMTAGASVHHESFNGQSNLALAFHFQKQFGRIFYLGTVFGFQTRSSAFAGANATLQLGPVQLFAATDNLVTLFQPTSGKTTTLRAGLNMAFKGKEKAKD